MHTTFYGSYHFGIYEIEFDKIRMLGSDTKYGMIEFEKWKTGTAGARILRQAYRLCQIDVSANVHALFMSHVVKQGSNLKKK